MSYPRRPIPIDFVETYLEIGWDGINDHYGTHNSTVARWVTEAGGDDLREQRAAIVRKRRRKAHIMGRVPLPMLDGILVDPEIVSAAAQWLRHREAGGWTVSPTGKGDWRIGTMRKSPAQMVEMAEARGFNRRIIHWVR